jgi:hypothetical protein
MEKKGGEGRKRGEKRMLWITDRSPCGKKKKKKGRDRENRPTKCGRKCNYNLQNRSILGVVWFMCTEAKCGSVGEINFA